MKKLDFIILSFILILAFSLRLYKITIPLADYYSWRQTDTSAVSRNFVKNGIDMLHPIYEDQSSIETGLENPKGYRMVEFPIYNAIVATFDKVIPTLSIEVWGRLVTSFFSLIAIGVIYYIGKKEVGIIGAVTGALTYAVFPFFVYFSRTILPDTTAVSLAFLSIFFLYLWQNQTKRSSQIAFWLLSSISFSLGLLVKPTVIFYGLPLAFIVLRKLRFSVIKNPMPYIYAAIAFAPLAWWRHYILSYPEGIPANDWLITSVNTYIGLQNIFFKPAFFRWIFFERINNHILGGFMTFFFGLGLISKGKTFLINIIALAALSYLLVFQGGNVQHEYYQIMILPPIALLVGSGFATIFSERKTFVSNLIIIPLLLFFVGLSLFFSYYTVRDFYNYPAELPRIGKLVNELTNDSDRIVTDREGDSTLLYLTGRNGAPAIYKDPPELKKLGYTHLLTLKKETAADVERRYQLKIIFESDEFTLFKL